MNDLFDGLVLVARFTGLDEVCIFNAAGSIVHNLDPVFMSQFRNSFNVSHGNRLSILAEMDRGVTMLSGETGYLKKQTQMIFSVISNREVPKIEKLIHTIDPESFMVVNRVSEVSGRGFSMKKRYR
mgnify:CR=1 FL=1